MTKEIRMTDREVPERGPITNEPGWDPAEGGTYGGVPLSRHARLLIETGSPGDPYVLGWRDGVDAAQGHGTGQGQGTPEMSAFVAVTEDRREDAVRTVTKMSPRDRAVLSFWLKELEGVLEDIEETRRMHRFR